MELFYSHLSSLRVTGVCVHTSVYLKQTDNCSVCELKICTSLAYLWCANANCTHKSSQEVFGVCSNTQ